VGLPANNSYLSIIIAKLNVRCVFTFDVYFARAIEGIMNKANRGQVRAFSVGVGILSVAISVLIFMTPAIGAIFASFIVGIALLVMGIYMIAAGLSGRTESIVSPTANIRLTGLRSDFVNWVLQLPHISYLHIQSKTHRLCTTIYQDNPPVM
jgi:hypothetical protein